jgi:hypothetical protein
VHYLVIGNMAEVARRTRIPHRTLLDWMRQEWWIDLVAVTHVEHNDHLDGRMTGLIDKALSVWRKPLRSVVLLVGTQRLSRPSV